MTTIQPTSELQKYNPSEIIELYEIHLSQQLHYEQWKASTVYAEGDTVSGLTYQTTGYVFECIGVSGSGTTGSSEPTWPTVLNNNVNDPGTENGIQWKAVEPVKRFHSGVNNTAASDPSVNSLLNAAIVFGAKYYEPFPIACEGFEYSSEGQLPRPTITISNLDPTTSDQWTSDKGSALPSGTISSILMIINNIVWSTSPSVRATGNDLVGAKLIRIRTLVKYLDGSNDADSNYRWPDEVYFIARKAIENKDIVQWECAASFDMAGVRSNRQILPDEFPGVGTFHS